MTILAEGMGRWALCAGSKRGSPPKSQRLGPSYPPTPCFFATADSKGVASAFFVTADYKGVSGLLREAERMVGRREARGERRPDHAAG